MSRSILEYLEHILRETDFILRESKKVNYKSFAEDEKLTRAFARSLEIIGEASKNIPSEFKIITRILNGKRWPVCEMY